MASCILVRPRRSKEVFQVSFLIDGSNSTYIRGRLQTFVTGSSDLYLEKKESTGVMPL